MKNEPIIDINEVRNLFRKNYKESRKRFTEKNFLDFIKFLEIDFYDWVRDNLKEFDKK